jgi:hypothetical protein
MADPFYDTVTEIFDENYSVNDQAGFWNPLDDFGFEAGEEFGRSREFPKGYAIGRMQGYLIGQEDGDQEGFNRARTTPYQNQTYADGLRDGEFSGARQGRSQGIGIGRIQGSQSGYQDGYDQASVDGFYRGLSTGSLLVVPGDSTSPTVTISSAPSEEEDPYVLSVYDSNDLRLVQLTCQDRTDGPKLIVYDDTGFQHPFGGRSTVTGTGTASDPFIFTIYRRGRWPTGVDFQFKARAIDVAGNQTSA